MATYNDYPEAAVNAAKKALRWKEKYGDEVKAGTAIGWIRANQLANRESLSYSTIARMAAFNRHRKNSKVDPKYAATPWKDRGYVAWLIWGGTAGVDWAIRKAEGIREGRYAIQTGDGVIKESRKAPSSDSPNTKPKGVGKGGKLGPDVIKSIVSKIKKHNEQYPDKKVSITTARKVVLRGMGAFNTSHSPVVKSATQWGLARLNAFLYLIVKGKPQNPKYTTDNDLLPKSHPKSSK